MVREIGAQALQRELESLLGPERSALLRCVDTADSTNSMLRELARAGAEEGTTLIALRQTAGRGRQGRSFCSPPGGLYLSLLITPAALSQPAAVTARAGVAAAEAVEAVCGLSCGIKWVNDLVYRERKVCGILAEGLSGLPGGSRVVLGLGLNVHTPRASFPPELRDTAASLADFAPGEISLPLLAAQLIRRLDRLRGDPAAGARQDLEAYRARCVTLGREVVLDSPEGELRAFAEGLGEDYSLLLRFCDGSRRAVSSGEVRLKKR